MELVEYNLLYKGYRELIETYNDDYAERAMVAQARVEQADGETYCGEVELWRKQTDGTLKMIAVAMKNRKTDCVEVYDNNNDYQFKYAVRLLATDEHPVRMDFMSYIKYQKGIEI